MRLDDLRSYLQLIEERLMMELEDDVEGAVGTHLDAALADLRQQIGIGPPELLGHSPHDRAIELPLAGEGGGASGALDGSAVLRIATVPHDAARPGLEQFLGYHPRGHRARLARGVRPARSSATYRHRRGASSFRHGARIGRGRGRGR